MNMNLCRNKLLIEKHIFFKVCFFSGGTNIELNPKYMTSNKKNIAYTNLSQPQPFPNHFPRQTISQTNKQKKQPFPRPNYPPNVITSEPSVWKPSELGKSSYPCFSFHEVYEVYSGNISGQIIVFHQPRFP